MALGNNQKVITIAGYVAFFVTLFFFFLLVSFPVDRFTTLAETQLSDALGRKVSIGDLGVTWTGGLELSDVEIEVPSGSDVSPGLPSGPAGAAPESGKKPAKPAESGDGDIRRLEVEVSEKLGAKVKLSHTKKGSGKLVISYNNLDELDGILKHIK